MSDDRYPWIPKGPVARVVHRSRPTTQPTGRCARCGYWWIGERVMCPACLAPSEGKSCAHCRRIIRAAAGECEHGWLCETCRRALEVLDQEASTDAV